MLLYRSKNSVLVGTVHLLPERLAEQLKSTIPDLVRDTDRLILECEFSRPGAEPPGARLGPGERLDRLVPQDLFQETVEAGKRLEIDADDLATCRPWWLAERLGSASTAAQQNRAEFSAEVMAWRLARAAGKKIRYLEPAERGYRCRSNAPLCEQLWALEFEVRRASESTAETSRMIEAFESGDASAWEPFLIEGQQHQPEMTDCMFRQRNLEWLPILNSEFAQGKALVIVGALHLFSEVGVLALLEKSGRKFRR